MYILTPHKRLEVDYGLPWVYENEVLPLTNDRNEFRSSLQGQKYIQYYIYNFADYQNTLIDIEVINGMKYYSAPHALYNKTGILYGGQTTRSKNGSYKHFYDKVLDCGIRHWFSSVIYASSFYETFLVSKHCKEQIEETSIEIPFSIPSDCSEDSSQFFRRGNGITIDSQNNCCEIVSCIQGGNSVIEVLYGKIHLDTLVVESKTFEIASFSVNDDKIFYLEKNWYIKNSSEKKLYKIDIEQENATEAVDIPTNDFRNIYLTEKNEKDETILYIQISTNEFIKYNLTRKITEDTYPINVGIMGLTKLNNYLFYFDRGNTDSVNAYYGDAHYIYGYDLTTKILYKLNTDYNVPIYIDKNFVYSVTTPMYERNDTGLYSYSYTGKEWKVSTDLIKKVLFKDSNIVS